MVSRKNNPPRAKPPKYSFVVSACLAGVNCTFKGTNNLSENIRKLYRDGTALAVCPEVAGGLCTPRERSEIFGGGGEEVLKGNARVLSHSGKDITTAYIRGAVSLCRLVKHLGIRKAILKSDSPACSIGRIYDGTFSKKFRSSDGVFAAALRLNGVVLYDEKTARRSDIFAKRKT